MKTTSASTVVYRRRLIREKVLQVLYAYEISKEPLIFVEEQQLDELKTHRSEFEFAKELISHVVQHEAELDAIIKSKAFHWEFDRIAVIDKILLRMGICELIHFPDIPPKVTINEAIEIAKAYSTTKSGPFINGILDAIHNELKNSSSLHKTGRGLLTKSLSPGPPHAVHQPAPVAKAPTVSRKPPLKKKHLRAKFQKGI